MNRLKPLDSKPVIFCNSSGKISKHYKALVFRPFVMVANAINNQLIIASAMHTPFLGSVTSSVTKKLKKKHLCKTFGTELSTNRIQKL